MQAKLQHGRTTHSIIGKKKNNNNNNDDDDDDKNKIIVGRATGYGKQCE